jgi:hypothetical protein
VSGKPFKSSPALSTFWRNTDCCDVRERPVTRIPGSARSARPMNLKSQVSVPWTNRTRNSFSFDTRT